MDVDYQGNKNLLEEAQKGQVSKFIYFSVLNASQLQHLKVVEAKELFVQELKQSGINFMVIRPNGFFSDMSEFFHMAQKGKAYLFGKGGFLANPIHGHDLANFCLENIDKGDVELDIGGPQLLQQNEIAKQAFEVLGKKPKIGYIPIWVKDFLLWPVRLTMPSKKYGAIEFFMTVMAMDMVAPKYGIHTILGHFESLNKTN